MRLFSPPLFHFNRKLRETVITVSLLIFYHYIDNKYSEMCVSVCLFLVGEGGGGKEYT